MKNTEGDLSVEVCCWVEKLCECLKQLQEELKNLPERFSDYEVVPGTFNKDENLNACFIVGTRLEKEKYLQFYLQKSTERLKEIMAVKGFADVALQTLKTDVASFEEIDNCSGRHYFVR